MNHSIALSQHEAIQQIIGNLPAVVFEYTFKAEGSRDFTYLSPRCDELLGIKRELLLGGTIPMREFIHPDDWESLDQMIQQTIKDMKEFVWEGRVFSERGTIWVEAKGSPIKLDKGVIVCHGIITDITTLKNNEKAILTSETLFTQLFHNAPLAIVLLNKQGLVTNVNKGFEEVFGYGLKEIKGRDLEDFIVPGELTEEGNDINNIITGNKVICVETVRINKNRIPLSVIIYGFPVRLEDQVIGIFGVYVDITESKRTEEELKIRNSELDNFVYKVSHDLRAPLSSILGLVNLAKLPNNNDNLIEYFDIVGRKVEQLDHFIGDVLSHSKNLKTQVKIGSVDIAHIIDETSLELAYLEGADQVKWDISIVGQDFHSDLWRIREIFRNLISNAIKYRNKALKEVNIRISVQIDRPSATIIFEDNGMGIEEDKIGHIYDMFYRASEVSDGSGLGLYIVRNSIEKLNGTIEVSSKPNYGTTFSITLPNIKVNTDDH